MAVRTAGSQVETQLPSGARERSWIAAATRAHALLTQILPDELLDEISAGHAADRTPIKLPAVLVG